jgi:hypothetical protein
MGKGNKKGKTYAKASRKAAALLVKGANSTHMAKGRLATERQERNRQHQEVMEVTTPSKPPPPARESVSDTARLAAREGLKADRERQPRNEEWRRLHELGSPVEYDHSPNRATQLASEDMTTYNDNEPLTLEWSEDTKNIMQTEVLDENKKRKAWGSLRTLTGNKGSLTASPKKKKARQVNVDSAEKMTTMVIDVDWEKDIHATQQPVPTSSVEVLGKSWQCKNEDEEDEDEEAGKEEVTDFTEVLAKGLPEATMYNEAQTAPLLQDPPSILKASKKKLMLEVATGGTTKGINPFFAPGSSHNKEGIPAEAFKNMVYLKPMITVPPKPKDFSGTALKWALLQFTEWFEQSHEDLGEMVTLVLLSYVRSSSSEPEAIQDVKKHLKGTANNIKKHIFNFRPNNQASSKGKDYQLYTKI